MDREPRNDYQPDPADELEALKASLETAASFDDVKQKLATERAAETEKKDANR